MSSTDPPQNEDGMKRAFREVLRDEFGFEDELDRVIPNPEQSLPKKTVAAGLREHLEDVQRQHSVGTYQTLQSRLGFFERWCNMEVEGSKRIEYLRDLTGQDIRDFRDWRRSEGEWNLVTEESQMGSLKKFLCECEKPGWVKPGLSNKVPIPTVKPDDESREVTVRQEEAEAILDHLEKFEYASLQHCFYLVTKITGCRISGFQSLDECDYEYDEETGGAILKFRNRPETGTRLKNGSRSERNFGIDEDDREVIDDYIEHNRPDVVDDDGRKPLFATRQGRPAASTLRKYAYMWTRPCATTGECPLGRNIEECDAAQSNDMANHCPDSKSAHPIRRGRLTGELTKGIPPYLLAEKYDVSPKTLKKHYDNRSPEEVRRTEENLRRLLNDGMDRMY
ncbi:site-specific integrase [Halomarina oriensis]|uniref:Site-specific integrase n=1 Tax=Halomarina oriensis TaxID=671145 RepID=A0A6B0GPN7_9EURY|nr:site-specific integrase [Halomarina oriensis]MWG36690.1 site-specific integrase [Halomarina oriensis]